MDFIDDNLTELDNTIATSISNLNTLMTLGNIINTDGPSFATMEALELLVPGCLPDEITLNTFTIRNSQINKGYALEAFDVALKLTITNVTLTIKAALVQVNTTFNIVSKLWDRIENYQNKLVDLKPLLADTDNKTKIDSLVPLANAGGPMPRKPLQDIFNTSLDLLIISGAPGYKVSELIQTTLAYAVIVDNQLTALITTVAILHEIYSEKAYGEKLTNYILSIENNSSYLQGLLFSKKDLFLEVVKLKGFIPANSKNLGDAIRTVIKVEDNKRAFWDLTYKYSDSGRPALPLEFSYLYYYSINTPSPIPLFINGFVPCLTPVGVDTSRFNIILKEKIASIRNKFNKLNTDFSDLYVKLDLYEANRKAAWMHMSTYNAKSVVWPPADSNFDLVKIKSYYAEAMPKVLITSRLLIDKLREISSVNVCVKDLAQVTSRLFEMTVQYSSFVNAALK